MNLPTADRKGKQKLRIYDLINDLFLASAKIGLYWRI